MLLPDEDSPLVDANDIRDRLQHDLDLVIESGPCGLDLTTVVDLTGGAPELVREGKGALRLLGL